MSNKNPLKAVPRRRFLLALAAFPGDASAQNQSSTRLWYRAPASNWNEALPVGNGRLGAMVFGGVRSERLQLNESTLWSGAPREWNNPKARSVLPLVRQAVFEDRFADAGLLAKQMQGPYTESYMPMGDLTIEQDLNGEPSAYSRELDLDRAVASVSFQAGGVRYTREVFASFPDQVIVTRLTASLAGSLSFTVKLSSQLHCRVTSPGETLILDGKCPEHVEPNYRRNFTAGQAIRYASQESGEGMTFQVRARVIAQGGRVTHAGQDLRVEGAAEAVIMIAAATSYNGYDKSPGLEGKNPIPIATAHMAAAARKTFAALLAGHIRDYQPIFRRVSLDLGRSGVSSEPTVDRLKAGLAGDPALAALVFQYGRYLLIATSRPGGQPSNLKGIWNDRLRPEWSANWCIDHDAQMSYYPVETANLAEMHEPFLDLIEGIAVNGRKTAAINYGTRGWCAHHNSDIWRQSGPAGDWGEGSPHWALFAMSGPWLCQHYWEHYLFGGDKLFLKNKAWPVMRGAAEFVLDWLVEDGQGRLVTNPSVSPENTFVVPGSGPAQISMASTVDMSLAWDLFTASIETCRTLGIDADLAHRMEAALTRLPAPQIGRNGRLQEWFRDWDSNDPGHRHLSVLFGVFPGRQFSPLRTPQLAAAAKKILLERDASQYGWSLAWKAVCWARLREGDEAWRRLAMQVGFVESEARRGGPGWLYPNLFNSDPPYVLLNGNSCVTAAVVEMLLQSHQGEIDLLPALPSAWPSGSVTGLRARGGYEVDLRWAAGRLVGGAIRAHNAGSCRVRSPQPLRITSGTGTIALRQLGPGVIEFDARPGRTYHLEAQ